jgi:hypothetical protein
VGGEFGSGFESSEDVSWLAVPGQLVLSSVPLETAIRTEFAVEGANGAYGLASVDLDQDGDVDILGTTDSQRGILVWLNEGGNPLVLSRHVIDADFQGGTSLHAVDMDQDGDLDLVGAAQNPGNRIVWWRNDSTFATEWERFDIDTLFPVACNVFAADVNGDSWPDVLSTSWTTGRLNVWYHSGTDPAEWTEQSLVTGFRGAHSAVAGDVDGDGDIDVVGTGANDREVLLLLNQGGDPVDWSVVVVGDDLGGVRYAALGDVDGDHRLDIVAAAEDGKVVWWRNLGQEDAWERHVIDMTCLGGHWVDIEDVDGDGRNDVVVAAWVAANFFWYRNDGGEGDTWTRFEVGSVGFDSPLTAIAADIDGRGDLEVIGTDWAPGVFSWWEVSEFASSGQMVSSIVDLGGHVISAGLEVLGEVPDGTHIEAFVRSGEAEERLGNWTSVEAGGSVELEGPLLQYRLDLGTTDPAVSPIVRGVVVRRVLRAGETTQEQIAENASDWR